MNTIKPTVVRDTGTGGEEVISLNAWGEGWDLRTDSSSAGRSSGSF